VIDGRISIKTPYWRQAWATLAAEIRSGATEIALEDEPHGWRPGDELLIPDTRTPSASAELGAQTERVRAASLVTAEDTGWTMVDGGWRHPESSVLYPQPVALVILESPIAHDHLGWHDSAGAVRLLPDVGCLTQPVVFRSENPDGVRGHVFLTRNADQDVQGVVCKDLGRTTVAPLHSTAVDAQGNVVQIGTNQIGRYAWHHHHLLGRPNNGKAYQFRLQHFAIDGSPKWGVAVHGSSYGQVTNGCIYDCAGSALITEDPWVYGNNISHNLLVGKRPGSGQRIAKENGGRDAGDKVSGDHWHNRVGLGLASAMNRIAGNRIYGMNDGIGLAGIIPPHFYYPAERGICTCGGVNDPNAVNFRYEPFRYPFWFDTTGNVVWGCLRGIETWKADCFPTDVAPTRYSEGRANRNWTAKSDPHPEAKMFPGLAMVHCKNGTDLEDQQETATYGWRFLGDFAKVKPPVDNLDNETVALAFKPEYEFGHSHFDMEVRGYDVGYRCINARHYVRFVGSTFESPCVMYHPAGMHMRQADDSVFIEFDAGCRFDPPPGMSLLFADYWRKYDATFWLTTSIGRTDRRFLRPVNIDIAQWRDGRTLKVYYPWQHRDFSLPPIGADQAYADWPKGVNTNRQLIDLGTPVFGAAVPPNSQQEHEFGDFWISGNQRGGRRSSAPE
jgi:hypothetical protein